MNRHLVTRRFYKTDIGPIGQSQLENSLYMPILLLGFVGYSQKCPNMRTDVWAF